MDTKEVLMNGKKKKLKSRIMKFFPIPLCIELEEVVQSPYMDGNTKKGEILKLLQKYDVPYEDLGPGTNRYGVLIDGYVFKIALDEHGKIDNKREMKYSRKLYPYVAKVYECSITGLIAVFEYVTIFTLDDFTEKQDEMREILSVLAKGYLIGDIGATTKNYVNWGTRTNGTICVYDFAYTYSVSYRQYRCNCADFGVLEYDNDYNKLKCPYCGKKYEFKDVRSKISNEDQDKEIGDVKDMAYIVKAEEDIVDFDENLEPEDISAKKSDKKKKDKELRDAIKQEKRERVKAKHAWDYVYDSPPSSLEEILEESNRRWREEQKKLHDSIINN